MTIKENEQSRPVAAEKTEKNRRMAIREFAEDAGKGTVAVYGLWLLMTLTANHFSFNSSREMAAFFALEGIPVAILFGLTISLINLVDTNSAKS